MRLVTKTQLAAKFGCSERTIDRWLANCVDLGRAQIGGKILFDEEKAEAAMSGRSDLTAATEDTSEDTSGVACARLSA